MRHLAKAQKGQLYPGRHHKRMLTDPRRTWFTITEMTSSMLILLPYAIQQATMDLHTTSQSPELFPGATAGKIQMTGRPALAPGVLSAGALTSGTLILVGGACKIRSFFRQESELHSTGAGHKRNPSLASLQSDSVNARRVRRVIASMLGVGLPFYATFHLGSERVGVVMLAALVTDLTNANNEPRDLPTRSGIKRLLGPRRWTMAVILLQLLYDVVGLTGYTSPYNSLLGYLILAICIFALPPPFSTAAAKKTYVSSPIEPPSPSGPNVLATLREAPSAVQNLPAPDLKASSLMSSPEDIDLTLAAGAVLGILTFVISFFVIPTASDLSYFSYIGGFAAVCAAAFTLTTTQTQRLRQSRGVGLLIASTSLSLLLAIVKPTSWTALAFQGFLISMSFTAIALDTHKPMITTSNQTHTHTHLHSHHEGRKPAGHEAHPSSISCYLISQTGGWPLLHSILLEKDSRRIFYFML